jgi:hypothetical protein
VSDENPIGDDGLIVHSERRLAFDETLEVILANPADKKNKRRFRLISCLPLTEPALDFRGLRPPAGVFRVCRCARRTRRIHSPDRRRR